MALVVLAGTANAGVLTETGPDGLVQRISKVITGQQTLRYPGAEYVKLHFARVDGPVTVSTVDGAESHRVDRPGWAMSISADMVVVRGDGVVDRVARGTRTRKEESNCGPDEKTDAVCYRTTNPVAYGNAKAVARMLIKGTELCTGFRVGPSNRMMTNYHCVGTPEEAADTEVWFNYQCAECGGYAVFRTTKVWLSEVLASDKTLDYTIFSVSNFSSVEKFGYLELDVRRPARGEELYVPQHPGGKPAMIAMGNCAVDEPYYEGYAADTDISYYCDTEGGSSGSPVLARETHRVVALHHFGGCPNSGVRMDRIYPQVQHLL
ncbi:trypsin-like serine peptidase [Allorhizocola rhizosphaerae]|uniref:trypsin-like serine peptidase n=1 Tax=Allorhizocola rhizosphaerae TaxID=1872709 RepID=UPI001FE651A0|nr:serine protease [Allorhizocola rhizosphaerae]